MENKFNNSGALILGLLGIAFIVLKLTNVISWSWWLVTLPFWGGFALAVLVVIILSIVPTKPKIQNINHSSKKSTFDARLEEAMKRRKSYNKK